MAFVKLFGKYRECTVTGVCPHGVKLELEDKTRITVPRKLVCVKLPHKMVYWRTAQGAYCDIKEMSNPYIENCIGMLKRSGKVSWRTVRDALRTVVGPDMDDNDFKEEFDRLTGQGKNLSTWLDKFQDELDRRKK